MYNPCALSCNHNIVSDTVFARINDLMEFLLLRSGRLVFYPSTSREAIVLDNVIKVNHAEDRIKDLLSVVAVRMTEVVQPEP